MMAKNEREFGGWMDEGRGRVNSEEGGGKGQKSVRLTEGGKKGENVQGSRGWSVSAWETELRNDRKNEEVYNKKERKKERKERKEKLCLMYGL